MRYKLDKEEQALLHSLEEETWVEVPNFQKEKRRYAKAAQNTFNKTKRVNLRLTEGDFSTAHVKALEEGVPYQTLLASVIHKYLAGKLVEAR